MMNFYPFNKEGVIVKDNKAVLSCHGHHLCGYVALPINQVPETWLGNYDADALQYLNIHGGLTFCECYNNSDMDAKIMNIMKDEIANFRADNPDMDFLEKSKGIKEIQNKYNKEIVSLPDSYVVFGFDCAHLDDDLNFNLSDPNYVMQLTEDMEKQLLAYAKRIDEWRSADRETKIEIIDEIRATVKISNDLGFGAMIEMLGGSKVFKDKTDE